MHTDTVDGRPNVHEMVVIHRIFRRGFADLADLARRVPPGETAWAEAVAAHVEFMLNGLHHHHTSEDDYLWPLLLERTEPDAALVERMEAQHEAVAGHVARVRDLLPAWRKAPSGTELGDSLEALVGAVEPHLQEEETVIVPLVAEHVTTAEWRTLGDASFAKFTNDEKLIALGQMLDVATTAEAASFLQTLPWPVRVIWRVSGRRRYVRYMAAVNGQDRAGGRSRGATPGRRSGRPAA
jgi:iron-sulfur cluster repair protein YtfE (RIC family)